jgi:NAD(P)-dependent dehydrogenase (short-subunit alcohol dehydrogenase family)
MTCAVVSGCATGIGAATRARLEAQGCEVIGIDLAGVEVEADLSLPAGRKAAIDAVLERSGGRLDRAVMCAGLGGHIDDIAAVVSVNYFGAVELLDGLLPALREGDAPAAVAICSNSAQMMESIAEADFVQSLLDHDEERAREQVCAAGQGQVAYMGSKNALGRAIRRRAREWGQAGVRLNAVAPGVTRTPLLEGGLASPGSGEAIRALEVPLDRWAEPDEIAGVVAFLLGPEAANVHGAVWYTDGGTDAVVRPERF